MVRDVGCRCWLAMLGADVVSDFPSNIRINREPQRSDQQSLSIEINRASVFRSAGGEMQLVPPKKIQATQQEHGLMEFTQTLTTRRQD
jgi:hypothetical protein